MQHLVKKDFILDKYEKKATIDIQPVDLNKIGDVLKRLREAKGWSQFDLATESETNNNLVCKMENAQWKNPSINKLDILTRALGLTLSEFFAEVEREQYSSNPCGSL